MSVEIAAAVGATAGKYLGNYFSRRDSKKAQKRQEALNRQQMLLNQHYNNQSAAFEERKFREAIGQYNSSFHENKRQFQLAFKANRQDEARRVSMELNKYRNAVKDAQAAGLHPLFALGGGVGGAGAGMSPQLMGAPSATVSPGSFIPGQSPSGSYLDQGVLTQSNLGAAATALGEAGQNISEYFGRYEQDQLQTALVKQQIAESQARQTADEARALLYASDAKTQTARGNVARRQVQEVAARAAAAKPQTYRTIFGNIQSDPDYDDAQKIADRYDDGIGAIHGLGLFAKDAARHVAERELKRVLKAYSYLKGLRKRGPGRGRNRTYRGAK